MSILFRRRVILSAGILAASLLLPFGLSAAELTGADIVQRCDLDKNPGKDQRTELTVILRDAAGSEKKNVYRRYWKDFGGKDQFAEKLVLFTEFPPDAAGTGFMRWGYVAGVGKNAEQFLYLPSLKTMRRVSVRDPGDSFLGSDLTYQDISPRPLGQDEHRLLGEEEKDGISYYVVESIPKEEKPLYGKLKIWYQKAPDWADCNKRRIEHYDDRGNMIKVQTLSWQKVDQAWAWDEVFVENLKVGHSSIFRVADVNINVGLKDNMFTERMLKRGIRE
jgi:hypothetical protein